MTIKYFLLSALLFSFIMQADAQYKRKGETLQTRGNKGAGGKKSVYSLAQLQGKWQEYDRKDRSNNTSVSFTDSIQMIFSDTNKVQTRTSVITSMNMKGEAEIGDDNTLTVAADEYTIKSLSTAELVLDDNDKFIHTLRKVDSFWYEKLGKLAAKTNDYSTPVKAAVNDILGKWSVYRRQAMPGATGSDVMLIRYLNIPSKKDEHTAVGDITFYQGQTQLQLPCTVSLNGSDIKIVAGSNKWELSVYQADGSNFVFGNSSLVYFCKPTK